MRDLFEARDGAWIGGVAVANRVAEAFELTAEQTRLFVELCGAVAFCFVMGARWWAAKRTRPAVSAPRRDSWGDR